MALQLLDLSFIHLLPELHHFLIDLIVLGFQFEDLFVAFVGLHSSFYITSSLLSPIRHFAFLCQALL